MIYRLCRSRLNDDHAAEDATQETFVRLLRADRRKIEHPDRWLCAVAVRVCHGVHRQRYRMQEDALADGVDLPAADDVGEEATDSVWLTQLGQRLRPQEYRLLVWLYVQRVPIDEVAHRLGVTNGNVRIMAYRARHKARLALVAMGHTLCFAWAAYRAAAAPSAASHHVLSGIALAVAIVMPGRSPTEA